MYTNDDLLGHVKRTIELSQQARAEFWARQAADVVQASRWMGETFRNDGKILIFGNGGSAADAQHMAAEMVGRMIVERNRPLPAIALTTDTSCLTAVGNDYCFEDIFSLQVKALGRKGDLAIAISTSGNSKNVIRAISAARDAGMRVVSMTGGSGGQVKELSDINLNVALGKNSSMIQETHLTILHLLVDLMDRYCLPDGYVKT